jgi:hypothetical protein
MARVRAGRTAEETRSTFEPQPLELVLSIPTEKARPLEPSERQPRGVVIDLVGDPDEAGTPAGGSVRVIELA